MKLQDEDKGEDQLASTLLIAIGIGYLFPLSALTQPGESLISLL